MPFACSRKGWREQAGWWANRVLLKASVCRPSGAFPTLATIPRASALGYVVPSLRDSQQQPISPLPAGGGLLTLVHFEVYTSQLALETESLH